MIVTDPITGTPRLAVPTRAKRLGARPDGCPFCGGNEAATPPPTCTLPAKLAVGEDWRARTFSNLYPLTAQHEVLVPTPEHITAWRDLSFPQIEDALTLLISRRAELVTPGSYVHAFINDGAAAGASLPHVHAQLLVLERAAHTEQLTAHTLNIDTCAICALATQHPQLLVEQAHHHALWAHPAPRMGGGLVIAPLDHSSPLGEHIAELAHLLMRAIAVCGPQDLNCWLVADEQTGAHWYLEVQPRTAQLAGVELALSLNVIAAEPAHIAAVARERLGHVTSSAPR